MPCLCPPRTFQTVLSAGELSRSGLKHLRQFSIRAIQIQLLSTTGGPALTVVQITVTAFKCLLSDQPKYVIGNDAVLSWPTI